MALDHYTPIIMIELLRRLEDEAPGIDVYVHPAPRARVAQVLEEERVDLALGGLQGAPSALKSRVLLTDDLACVVRTGHPTVGAQLDIDSFCRFEHLLISPSADGTGIVDAQLAKIGRERRIRATTPSFLAAPLIVASSNLELTAPRILLRFMVARAPLRMSGGTRRPLTPLVHAGIAVAWADAQR